MQHIVLKEGADLDGFRAAVRLLIARDVTPDCVTWSIAEASLFAAQAPGSAAPAVPLPRTVAELVELVVCHADRERYALLYALVWRIRHGEPALLEVHSDPLVHRLSRMAKSVRRDIHKMHAFLRFRRVDENLPERFVAWFEPEHFILQNVAPFFVRRFPSMQWAILTPQGTLTWDGERLITGTARNRGDAPREDAFEEGWRAYYESVFNPARTNPKAMRAEMAKKYWRNLPEAQSIPRLIRTAQARTRDMLAREAATPRKRNPEKAVAAMAAQEPQSLAELNALIARLPPLVPGAPHAVLGEGPTGAAIAFVGEQPGDQEDLQGQPFVGPAGQLLRAACVEAGVDVSAAYLTNAVKHFKFQERGKRRIHQKPTLGEVKHYRWWLEKELGFVRPKLVVALGGTAAVALLGRSVSVTRERGPTDLGSWPGYITVHPSYLLRLPNDAARETTRAAFVADLRRARALAQGSAASEAA